MDYKYCYGVHFIAPGYWDRTWKPIADTLNGKKKHGCRLAQFGFGFSLPRVLLCGNSNSFVEFSLLIGAGGAYAYVQNLLQYRMRIATQHESFMTCLQSGNTLFVRLEYSGANSDDCDEGLGRAGHASCDSSRECSAMCWPYSVLAHLRGN